MEEETCLIFKNVFNSVCEGEKGLTVGNKVERGFRDTTRNSS